MSALAQFIRRSVADSAQQLSGSVSAQWLQEQPGHRIAQVAKQLRCSEHAKLCVADEAEWLHQVGVRQALLRDAPPESLLVAYEEYQRKLVDTTMSAQA